MLNVFIKNRIIMILVFIYVIVNSVMIYLDNYYLLLIPVLLIVSYLYIYHLNAVFLLIVFFTPLSFNFEDLELGGIGLYFPTEPMLLVFSVIFILKYLKRNSPKETIVHYKHPITILIIIQLIWIIITSLFSDLFIISIKFFISRSWFVIPVFFYAIHFFKEGKHRILQFLWCFITPMFIVTCYTLINHMNNSFSEASGHWVMWPFFKDHTSYGAILALSIPITIWLLSEYKKSKIKYLLCLFLVVFLIGIYFSYTRAAWLSIFGALIVYLLYYYKIKFKWIISFLTVFGLLFTLNFNSIYNQIEKNDSEHTTENFSERLESMSNVSSDASNLERLNRWNCAVKLFKEKPFLGWGPGTYSFVYAPFQESSDLTIISTNFGNGGNAHSEYLGPLAEQGIIGLLIMVTLVGIFFYLSGKYYIKSNHIFNKQLCLMIILALTTYFSHGVLNNYLDTDKASIPIWGLLAMFVCLDTYYDKVNKSTERIKNK